MEITSTTTKRVRADGVQKRRLATRLSMYTAPPGQDVSLDEFEELAYNRLQVCAPACAAGSAWDTHGRSLALHRQVLKAIESAYERGLKGEEFKSSVRPLIEKKLRLRYSGDQRKDNISHFTLRLGALPPPPEHPRVQRQPSSGVVTAQPHAMYACPAQHTAARRRSAAGS